MNGRLGTPGSTGDRGSHAVVEKLLHLRAQALYLVLGVSSDVLDRIGYLLGETHVCMLP